MDLETSRAPGSKLSPALVHLLQLQNLTFDIPNMAESSTHAALTSAGGPGLIDLPAELTERIAQFCDPYDLIALRQANREIEAKVLRTFIKAHFTERAFLISYEPSLRTLNQVVKHPRFGKALKKLTFCFHELPQWDKSRRGCSLLSSDEMRYPAEAANRARAQRRSEEETYDKLIEQQERFQEQHADYDLLTTIFARLKLLNSKMDIKLRSLGYFDDDKSATHGRALRVTTGEELIPGYENRSNRVIEALAQSALPVETLTVAYEEWKWFLLSFGSQTMLEYSSRLLAGLKHLSLRHTGRLLPGNIRVKQVPQILSAARNLETLSLDTPGNTRAWMQEPYTLELHFPALTKFSIHGCLLDITQVTDFICRHKALRAVNIITCHFLIEEPNEEDDDVDLPVAEHDEGLVKMLNGNTGVSGLHVKKLHSARVGVRVRLLLDGTCEL